VDEQGRSWFSNLPQWATLIIALFVYGAGMLVWGAKVGLRVDYLENHVQSIDQKLGKLEESDKLTSDRLLIINERQQGVLNILGDNGKKLEGINSTMLEINRLLHNHDNRFVSPPDRMKPEPP